MTHEFLDPSAFPDKPSLALVNVGDLRRNSGECEWGVLMNVALASPDFAKLRWTSPRFA